MQYVLMFFRRISCCRASTLPQVERRIPLVDWNNVLVMRKNDNCNSQVMTSELMGRCWNMYMMLLQYCNWSTCDVTVFGALSRLHEFDSWRKTLVRLTSSVTRNLTNSRFSCLLLLNFLVGVCGAFLYYRHYGTFYLNSGMQLLLFESSSPCDIYFSV